MEALARARVEAACNPLSWRLALRDRAGGSQPVARQDGTTLEVAWPDATCRFPSGDPGASTCTCRARVFCRHRARSLLWRFERDPVIVHGGPVRFDLATARRARTVLASGVRVERSEAEARIAAFGARLWRGPSGWVCACGQVACLHRAVVEAPPVEEDATLVGRLAAEAGLWLIRGLDRAPPGAIAGLAALGRALRAAGLPGAAADLARMAGPGGSGRARAWALARLAPGPVRLAGPRAAGRGEEPALSPLRLHGAGAEPVEGGLRAWFVGEDGALLPVDLPGADAERLWCRRALWGEPAVSGPARSRFRLVGACVDLRGVPRAGGPGRALVEGPATWLGLPREDAVGSVAELKARWTAVPLPRGETLPVLLLPGGAQGPVARRGERLVQRWTLARGGGIWLEADATSPRAVEGLCSLQAHHPAGLLGRVDLGPAGWSVRPIAAWLTPELPAVPIAVGPGLPGASAARPGGEVLPLPELDPLELVLVSVLDRLEGMALEGALPGQITALRGLERDSQALALDRGAAALADLGRALSAGSAAEILEAWARAWWWAQGLLQAWRADRA